MVYNKSTHNKQEEKQEERGVLQTLCTECIKKLPRSILKDLCLENKIQRGKL